MNEIQNIWCCKCIFQLYAIDYNISKYNYFPCGSTFWAPEGILVVVLAVDTAIVLAIVEFSTKVVVVLIGKVLTTTPACLFNAAWIANNWDGPGFKLLGFFVVVGTGGAQPACLFNAPSRRSNWAGLRPGRAAYFTVLEHTVIEMVVATGAGSV